MSANRDYGNAAPIPHVMLRRLRMCLYLLQMKERSCTSPTGPTLQTSFSPNVRDALSLQHCHVIDLLSILLDGFAPPYTENRHDTLSLPLTTLVPFTPSQKELLKGENYLGEYSLYPHTLSSCFRTQVALRCPPFTNERKWRHFMDGFSDGRDEQEAVNARLAAVLELMKRDAEAKLQVLTGMPPARNGRDVLLARWREIDLILKRVISTLRGGADDP